VPAAPIFVAGPAARGGVSGPAPDLSKLVDGDVPHAVDFRRVRAAVLDNWLRVPARDIIDPGFSPIDILETLRNTREHRSDANRGTDTHNR
jgi:uncharacterized protein (DUF1501 family)